MAIENLMKHVQRVALREHLLDLCPLLHALALALNVLDYTVKTSFDNEKVLKRAVEIKRVSKGILILSKMHPCDLVKAYAAI